MVFVMDMVLYLLFAMDAPALEFIIGDVLNTIIAYISNKIICNLNIHPSIELELRFFIQSDEKRLSKVMN